MNRIRFAVLSLIVCLLVNPATHAFGQASAIETGNRIALVIGNGAYEKLPALANPLNDARAIGKKLEALGFDVVSVLDRGRKAFEAELVRFYAAVETADTVLVYYAGHGVQLGGANYLIPIDADPEAGETVNDALFPLSGLLEEIEKRAPPNAAKIVILDACRENPWPSEDNVRPGTRGLAIVRLPEVDERFGGYFRIIAYSTAPGTVAEDGTGSNSPYTSALLRYIDQNGIEVTEMFRRAAAHVLDETEGRQKPEYLVQTSRTLFFRPSFRTECDELAAEKQNFVGVPGVAFDDINTAAAIPACRAAVAAEPDSPRLRHNLARALEKGQQLKEALAEYAKAADYGLPASINALGIMYLAGCGMDSPNVLRGVSLMVRAARFGDLEAETSLTAHDLLPHLSDRGRQSLQAALTGRALYDGPLDGKPNEALAEAVRKFQRDANLKEKGLTLETIHALGLHDAVPRGFRCH